MADFAKAFAKIIEIEGGFIDHPADPGGATNYGISLRWLKTIRDFDLGDIDHDGDIDYEDIKAMTIQDAAALYKKYWWDKYDYESIPDQEIANKLMDMSINMGAKQAQKLLQRAINNTLGKVVLVDDGIAGPKTNSAMASILNNPLALLAAMRAQQEGFYRLLVVQNNHFLVFLNGWIRRANS